METRNPRYDNDYVTLAFLKEYLGEEGNTDEIVKYSKNYGSQPSPPYNKNDTWMDETGLYVCVNPRSIGYYDPNDWQLIVDTKTINNYIITDELSLQDLLSRSETGKITTYVQLTDPAIDWDTSLAKNNHVYCLWKMLEDATSYIYIKLPTDPVTYTWSEIPDTVSEVWNLNGTKTIYGSKPQTYIAGDLWIIEEDATSIPEGCSPGDWVYAINSNTQYADTDWSKDSTVISQESLNSFTYDKTPELIDGLKYELSMNGRVVINGGNISAGSIQSNNYIPDTRGTKIQLSDGVIDTKNFKVDSYGNITATNGTFSGSITSTSGKIGNFTISQYSLVGGSGSSTVGMCSTSGQAYAFWAGAAASGSAPFRVGHDGSLTSSKGTIGGLTIASDRMYMSDTGLSSDGNSYAFWAGESNSAHGAASTNAKFKVGHDGILHAQNCIISGGTITGASSINIDNGSYWLNMGYGTGHPSVSGLNVGWGGMTINGGTYFAGAVQVDGFAACPDDVYFNLRGTNYNWQLRFARGLLVAYTTI